MFLFQIGSIRSGYGGGFSDLGDKVSIPDWFD